MVKAKLEDVVKVPKYDFERKVSIHVTSNDWQDYQFREQIANDMRERYGYLVDGYSGKGFDSEIMHLYKPDTGIKPVPVDHYHLNVYIANEQNEEISEAGIPRQGIHYIMNPRNSVQKNVDGFMIEVAYKPAEMVDSINKFYLKRFTDFKK